MRALLWSKTFVRSSRRLLAKRPELQPEIENTLRILAQNPFDAQLRTHKLKGKLLGTWACSMTYDYRIVFDFVKSREDKTDGILLIELGTHDEVY